MHVHEPLSTDYSVRRTPGVRGQSREGLVGKLNDVRCKWMVALHRYGSKTHRGSLHQDAARNDSVRRSSIPGRGLVPAADFCPTCGSIVPVELEYSNEGEFIAEHRWSCSVCEASTNKVGVPGSRRIAGTNHRRFLDEDWRLWEVHHHVVCMFSLCKNVLIYDKNVPSLGVYDSRIVPNTEKRKCALYPNSVGRNCERRSLSVSDWLFRVVYSLE